MCSIKPQWNTIFLGRTDVQSLSYVWLSATPWTAARLASLSITISRSLLKLTSIELVIPSNHLILCRPLLLLPSILPSIRWTDNQSTCPKRSWAIYRKDQISWCFKSSGPLPFSTGGPPPAQALRCRSTSYSRQVALPSSASVHLCSGFSNSTFLIMLLVRFDALTCVRVRLLHLCPTLCHPMDCSLPGSRMLQARILEWVAIPFSRRSSPPRDRTRVSRIAGQILYHLSHQGSCTNTQVKERKKVFLSALDLHSWHTEERILFIKTQEIETSERGAWGQLEGKLQASPCPS